MMWKKSLFLLAATTTRRDAVIAFVTPATFSSFAATKAQPATAATKGNDDFNIDVNTAPLKDLVQLNNCDKQPNNANKACYQLECPTADEIPLKPGQRLVCFGDVHGDFAALQEFLSLAEVYDASTNEWTGGDTILVQCGDVLDRGSQELQCFQLLTKLSQQAAQAGGAVVLLWGNHEALNAGGMFHYTTDDQEYEALIGNEIDVQLKTEKWRLQYAGNQPARWAAYEPGSGLLAAPLLANMKVAVKVGKTVCVHAGLTAKHLDNYGGIKGMNQMARKYIEDIYHGKNNNYGIYESMDDVVSQVQRRAEIAANRMPELLGDGESPVWMRLYSYPANVPPRNPLAQQSIDGALFHMGANRMVMGHTVQQQINAALQGKAWRVDVGASRGVMGGTPEVLEVVMQDDGRTEQVSILTRQGKVPAEDRMVDRNPATVVASTLSSLLSG